MFELWRPVVELSKTTIQTTGVMEKIVVCYNCVDNFNLSLTQKLNSEPFNLEWK